MATKTNFVYIVVLVLAIIVAGIAGYFIGRGGAPSAQPVTTSITIEKTVTIELTKTATVTYLPTLTTYTTLSPTPTTTTPTSGVEVYKIGALLPLSGQLASFGAELKTILEYVEQEINSYLQSQGKNWRIDIIIEDTAIDPKTHLEKLMSLHAAGVKIFIGGVSSAELGEALSYCNSKGILIVSPSSTSPALALPDMALRYAPPDHAQGVAIARILWERGVRWLIVMWRHDTWGDGLADATIKSFDKICEASGESCGIVERIPYDPNAKEFSLEVSQLASIVEDATKKYGKDKIGIALISFGEAEAVFAAAKNYPILSEVKWQGSDGTANIVELLNPGIVDMVVKVGFYSTMASPELTEKADVVKKVIREKLGRDPMGYTYFAYDIAWTLALAIDRAGKYDPIAVKEALNEVLKEYTGASGKVILDENGDRVPLRYDIWAIVKVGDKYEWKVVGSYDVLKDRIQWSS
jgi:branched-chain amino acid transport system substrate-binding protein